ncbi:MAG: hypothetical protein LCH47_09460 [Proteobacteria bacterium]|nr:hypothetical protein [Pseudomonadota bacterium]
MMIKFSNPLLLFDQSSVPYQRADDVGFVITEFLWFDGKPFYPASALAHAKVSQVALSFSEGGSEAEDNCDLIFQMPKAEGGHFFEIVLRSDLATFYGGWVWGEEIEYLDRYKNGYRVLCSRIHGKQVTFEYSEQERRYQPANELPLDKMDITHYPENWGRDHTIC